MLDKLHEECGVFGIFRRSGETVVPETYHALYALQHRGQESCGIAVNVDGVINCHKGPGLVNEVFTREALMKMPEGQIALGHCLYGSVGNASENIQPMLINHLKGAMALAHNGCLTNGLEIREELEQKGMIFHTSSNSEVIAYAIIQERVHCGSIEEAVRRAMKVIKGAYSLVIMSPTKLIAARDPQGIRPLCMGTLGEDVVFASESCAFNAIGATFERDIEPGEVVVVTRDGVKAYKPDVREKTGLCVFEYIYNARPDSVIDGASVHEARLQAGAFLAQEHPVEADVVIGVPDSGLDAALGYAKESGIPYGIGFIKNKYIGRTFIQPTQEAREDAVRIKLNVVSATVKGKRVVMVDDSIVRGTTSIPIIKLLRDAGAKEVHMRLSSPPFIRPCYFGTDVASVDKLIAANHTIDEIRDIIGVDSLGYLSVEACDKLAKGCGLGFCKGCFTGEYPVDPPKKCQTPRHENYLTKKD